MNGDAVAEPRHNQIANPQNLSVLISLIALFHNLLKIKTLDLLNGQNRVAHLEQYDFSVALSYRQHSPVIVFRKLPVPLARTFFLLREPVQGTKRPPEGDLAEAHLLPFFFYLN